MLQIKRIYEAPDKSDGYRILVDRLWPRGVSKKRAKIDLWAKEITPSNESRIAFGHKPENFEAFKAAYIAELSSNPKFNEFANLIKQKLESGGNVTLLYAAKNPEINHAVILLKYVEKAIE